jgi:hypothetical protein
MKRLSDKAEELYKKLDIPLSGERKYPEYYDIERPYKKCGLYGDSDFTAGDSTTIISLPAAGAGRPLSQ